jgi:ketosteroid isomerase-like protein
MSQENVETMRQAMEAFNEGDGMAFDRLLADDAVIVPVRAALEGTIYRGRNAGTQYRTAVNRSWDSLRWELEELRDGDDWVLALGHIRGQGRASGVAIDAKAGWLAQFREGLITEFQTFGNRDEALEAAGLRE